MNTRHTRVAGFAGYVADVVRLGGGQTLNLHSYMKYRVLRRLGARTGARCLIETGTFHGVTAARCARVFERVYTIELDGRLAREAVRHLQRFPNVEVLEGDATALLPRVLAKEDARDAVVFLDAHYSGGETARGPVPEPAVLELAALAPFAERICGVVIDDFRLFGVEPGFPAKAELVAAAERSFAHPRFTLDVHADQLLIERRRAR